MKPSTQKESKYELLRRFRDFYTKMTNHAVEETITVYYSTAIYPHEKESAQFTHF